ncbi:hypothetical protein GS415_04855 [Rhodococcus hoagii]|nr:hypothetical protein [Prescottella equi]
MTSSLAGAVARQQQNNPAAMIQSRGSDFARVLPKQIKNPDAWIRLAESAIAKSKPLQDAARNDPAALMRALMLCASLGHTPGTDHFYLVPVKGKIEGWESYKGIIRRILNTGEYDRVVAEVVYEGEDFEFDPNLDLKPMHKVDWAGRNKGMKPLMSYAYAVHHDGSPTRVAIADPGYIQRVKDASKNSGGVWKAWDDAMYLKCAIKRLDGFVKTSSEDMRFEPVAAIEAPKGDGAGFKPVVIDGEVVSEADEPEVAITEVIEPDLDGPFANAA